MEEERKLGLPSVIATCVGCIVATSCLLSIGQGSGSMGASFIYSMMIACFLGCLISLSIAELNALMPNITGGLAQYTLTCMGPFVTILVMVGGYIMSTTGVASIEASMFGSTLGEVFPDLKIPSMVFTLGIIVIIAGINLIGIDAFAKIQDFSAYALIGSLVILGFIGAIKAGTGKIVEQPIILADDTYTIFAFVGLAMFLFVAEEFVVPISKNVKNARRNIPLGMVLGLLIILVMQSLIVFGFYHYVSWDELAVSSVPHILYGTMLLGETGRVWMSIVSILAVISTCNSVMAGLSRIISGMAKINLLPSIFMKVNRKGVPYIAVIFIAVLMIFINVSGLTSSDMINILILSTSTIMMIAYSIIHINVLILRHRLPKAPRTFKVPFGKLLPIVGVIGNIMVIWFVSDDNATRMGVYRLCLGIFAVIAVYGVIWLKCVRKVPLFKKVALEKVMAMESNLYNSRMNI